MAAAGVVYSVRRAQLARKVEAALVDIDRDDGLAAGDFGRHQAGEAHRADPEDGKRIARLRFHAVEYGAGPSLTAAREWADQVQRRILSHSQHETLVGDRVARERGLLKIGAVNGRAVLPEERRAIRPCAGELPRERLLAVRIHVAAAVRAVAAPGNDRMTWSPTATVE